MIDTLVFDLLREKTGDAPTDAELVAAVAAVPDDLQARLAQGDRSARIQLRELLGLSVM